MLEARRAQWLIRITEIVVKALGPIFSCGENRKTQGLTPGLPGLMLRWTGIEQRRPEFF